MKDITTKFEEYKLIDIQNLDSTIMVDLKYSSNDNFMKKSMYQNLKKAYLISELAGRLVRVQSKLKVYDKNLSLIIYDAARPISIQQMMYESVKETAFEPYVANPQNNGGFHNYGMAVDLSITNINTGNLDMGSDFDFFGIESHVGLEIELLRANKITLEAVKNRFLLYSLMLEEELFPHPNEWWHYQYHQDEEDKKLFKLLDF